MIDIAEHIKGWKNRDAELDRRIAEFEKQYKHANPCEQYKMTHYCVHLVNAQQKRFGRETKALLNDLVALSSK